MEIIFHIYRFIIYLQLNLTLLLGTELTNV